MIDEEKTLKQFGYTSDSLSHGSNKKVVAICNDCGKERVLKFLDYRNLCISCTLKNKRVGKNNPMYGKKHSKETKKKMSKSRSGEKNPMFNIHRYGKNSPNWNGGISFTPYCKNFNNEIKEQIREEFNRKCFLCRKNETNRKLSIHHIDYDKSQGCNSDWKLVPLCIFCHTKTSGKYIRDYYEELILRLLYIRDLIFEYNNKIDFKSI